MHRGCKVHAELGQHDVLLVGSDTPPSSHF